MRRPRFSGLAFTPPILLTAATTAWPGMRGGSTPEGYLINRLAYRDQSPMRDDLVWYRSSPSSEPRLGQVVAGSGQEVHWSENRLQVDGVSMKRFGTPFRSVWPPPRDVAYRIPDRHVLILPEGSPTNPHASEGLLIVATDQVVGRAWAKYYPVRDAGFCLRPEANRSASSQRRLPSSIRPIGQPCAGNAVHARIRESGVATISQSLDMIVQNPNVEGGRRSVEGFEAGLASRGFTWRELSR